jgi:release factor glutamine methyltransferase
MQLQEWLNKNRKFFNESDLRFLIKNELNNTALLFSDGVHLSSHKLGHLESVKEMYIKGMPLAYILGKEDFLGWEFKVNKEVLVPRRETELITEKAIDIIKKENLRYVLDLCCGCGNIAISIKKSSKDTLVFASDISPKALRVAKANAEFHNTGINLISTDLFKGFKYGKFDIIISNPPYVEEENIKGALEHEPRIALWGGADGLYFIKKIIGEAYFYLKESGYLVLEIGSNHKEPLERYIDTIKSYEIIEWIKDYSGNWRGTVLRPKIKNQRSKSKC